MPEKILSSLLNSDLQALNPSTLPADSFPPGTVVDVAGYKPPLANPALEAGYTTMYALAGSNISLVNQFMGTFNSFTNGLPGNISDFATDYVKFLVTQGLVPNTDTAINAAVNKLLNGFATSYETSISLNNPAEAAQMTALFPNLATYGLGNVDDPDQMGAVTSFWSAFVKVYNYQSSGALANGTTTPAQGFFQQLSNFSVVTATLTPNLVVTVNTAAGGGVNAVSNATPSFQQLFSQYFPNLPVGGSLYQTTLASFERGMIATYGFFSPSQQYAAWTSVIQTLSGTVASPVATLPPTNVDILEKVFSLLTSMITAIQNVAASQANRLALYTSWQQGYTDLLNQVHVFTGSSKDLLKDFSGSSPFSDNPSLTTVQNARQNEQGNFNAAVTQQITAYSNVIQEDSKNLNSEVNQSTDAYNNQANTATTILQDLTTILNSIFR